MTNPSWDPTSFYLGLIPYRIGTQHPNSRRDSSFLGKRCREQKYFFRTKMKIRKNYIVGIFSKSLLELGQIPIRNGIYLWELDPNSRVDVRCISSLIGIYPTIFFTVCDSEIESGLKDYSQTPSETQVSHVHKGCLYIHKKHDILC